MFLGKTFRYKKESTIFKYAAIQLNITVSANCNLILLATYKFAFFYFA